MASALQVTRNMLRVTGPLVDVKAFKEMAESKPEYGNKQVLSFAAFIPVPPELITNNYKTENGSTVIENWCFTHWGTMHDATNLWFCDSGNSGLGWGTYCIEFTTCMPPFPVIEAISKKFPLLDVNFGWKYKNPIPDDEFHTKFHVTDDIYGFEMRNGVTQPSKWSDLREAIQEEECLCSTE